jgi:hypothetical protein
VQWGQQHTWMERDRSPWRPNKPQELISAILPYSQPMFWFVRLMTTIYAKGTRQLVKLDDTLSNLCSVHTLLRNPWHWHPTVVFSVADVTKSCPNHHEWMNEHGLRFELLRYSTSMSNFSQPHQ